MDSVKFLSGTLVLICLIGCASKGKGLDASKGQPPGVPPKLTKPVVQRIWVEPEVVDDGAAYVDGHFKYLIQRGPAWNK